MLCFWANTKQKSFAESRKIPQKPAIFQSVAEIDRKFPQKNQAIAEISQKTRKLRLKSPKFWKLRVFAVFCDFPQNFFAYTILTKLK